MGAGGRGGCVHGRERLGPFSLDNVTCLELQALEYQQQGRGSMETFMQTAVAARRTGSGRRLGEAAMRVPPAAWWQAFARAVVPVRPEGTGNGQ
jgi:hypothetical protein